MNSNLVFQNIEQAKHYRSFTPIYNFGTNVIIGKYGSMAMEHMKKTAPIAYEAYSAYNRITSYNVCYTKLLRSFRALRLLFRCLLCAAAAPLH